MIELRDRLGRRAIDMCRYTLNEAIHEAVFARTYQRELIDLEHGGSVVMFRKE